MGASARPYPEGVSTGVAPKRDQAIGAGYVLAEGQRKPVDVIERLEVVEKSLVLVLEPDSVAFFHAATNSEGGWPKAEP